MSKERTFQDLIDITRQVIKGFGNVEQRPWTAEATMIELMKQVGDLSKHIMVEERYYIPERANEPIYKTTVDNICDELADIFYCLIRLAEHYHIDLEQAHLAARRREMDYLGHLAQISKWMGGWEIIISLPTAHPFASSFRLR